jgi:hypothetical protein
MRSESKKKVTFQANADPINIEDKNKDKSRNAGKSYSLGKDKNLD